MAAARQVYRKKLNRVEVARGTILILKTSWRMFTAPGEPMAVRVGDSTFHIHIEAEDCVCTPPPHQHYHLPAHQFRHLLLFEAGRTVEIAKGADGSYRLEVL